jgi:hypothetical protein
MNESFLIIGEKAINFVAAGAELCLYTRNGKNYGVLDIWADTDTDSDHYLAINGFSVDACSTLADLQGRTFTLGGEDEGFEPDGDRAVGELMESVMGDYTDPYMFHSMSLTFARQVGTEINVTFGALVYNSSHANIPVQGNFTLKVGTAQ